MSTSPRRQPGSRFPDARSPFQKRPARTGGLALLIGGLLTIGWPIQAAAQDVDPAEQLRATISAAQDGNHARAMVLVEALIESHPELSAAHYWRGRIAFCLGRMDDSLNSFDRFVELEPEAKPRQWERGITAFYAGQFEKGAEQFELYQTYHDNDVENSVWRFLCTARTEGVDAARETMLPIRDDRRVPMMKIYEMYRGEATADDVFAAARAGVPDSAQLNQRLFYAHLYVGLYLEAIGDREASLDQVRKAREVRISHYMWNVADVHVALRDSDQASLEAGR